MAETEQAELQRAGQINADASGEGVAGKSMAMVAALRQRLTEMPSASVPG